jgi:WD40 repeat protein
MRVLRGHKDRLRAVSYSADGRMLATAGKDGMVKLWDLPSGKEQATLPATTDWRRSLRTLAFSPDGTLLATGGGWLSIWKLPTLELLTRDNLSRRWINALAFAADGNTLAVGGSYWGGPHQQNALHIWEVGSGRWRQLPGEGIRRYITSLAFLPGHDVLAAGQYDRQVQTPRGRRRLSVSFEHRVVFWNASSLQELRILPHRVQVLDVAFSPDGRTLATAAGKVVHLFDVTTGEPRATLIDHPNQVNTLAFTPDGRLLSGSNDETVRLWDVASGTQRAAYDWQLRTVRCVAVSPDGMTAAAVGDLRKVVIWDLDT